jgi:hypothetical protein
MDPFLPFRAVSDFLSLTLADQMRWLMRNGKFLHQGMNSLVYRLGELLVVVKVDTELSAVNDVQAYAAPGIQ